MGAGRLLGGRSRHFEHCPTSIGTTAFAVVGLHVFGSEPDVARRGGWPQPGPHLGGGVVEWYRTGKLVSWQRRW